MTLLDRYISWTVALFIIAAVFSFSVLIICNNFYASSDLLFTQHIPFQTVAMINLLDAPATIVLSLPVASLFGVMLAIGQLGRSSEITAMRCGGISLKRIMIPVLALSVVLSAITYLIDEEVVQLASQKAYELKSSLEGEEAVNIKQNVFFRNDQGLIIYAATFDTSTRMLGRVMVYEHEGDWTRVTISFSGRFDDDELVLTNGRTFLYDENGEMRGREAVAEFRRPFPESLQEVHEEQRDASTLAGGEIAEQISRLQEAGMNSIAYRTDLQFKYSTPVACFIFSFVGFIFSVFSPRKETFVGMLYAIILVLIYYVLISIFKSLGKQGIIPYPFISAWSTNVIFLIFGIYIFSRTRR
jgi:LPS export ABC transporter permease LptG